MVSWKSGRLAGWLRVYQASNLPILQLFLVWLLTVPAVTPFIQTTLPRSADGLLHLYRVVALDQAFQQGAFFPRWLPDLAYGYGFPLFVFYAPLAYYLTEGIHLLGFGFVEASNLSCALALFVAASGTYLFVRALLGIKPGILAAVAYVYAPYQLFDALARGSLPAVWAAAFLPWAFWAFDRLRRRRQPGDLILSGVMVALLLLSHNISSLLFFPLLTLYLLLTLMGRSPAEVQPHLGWRFFASLGMTNTKGSGVTGGAWLRNQWLATGLALTLGLGLAAFFWLPAVAERNFVQIERVITPPDFDYHAHFVRLSDLFSFPAPAETGLLNPDFPLTLGLAQVLIAAIGLVALLWRWLGPRKVQETPADSFGLAIFALLSLVGTIFMTLPLSVAIWERLPLIAFAQHPHRLLGVTALLLAVLAGVSLAVAPARWRLGLTVAGILLIFISTIPLLYPRYYNPLPAPLSLTGMFAYERSIGAIGTTSFGEYLPVWVTQLPRESPLETLYQSQSPVERLDASYLPAGSSLESARYGFNQAELVLDLAQPGQVVFNTFYFPGWQANLNGQPLALAPVTERGLIGLTLPAGRSHLALSFRETPIRLIANGISLVTLLLVALIALNQIRRKFTSLVTLPTAPSVRTSLTSSHFISLAGLALSLILAKMLYFDRFDTPLKHTFNGLTLTTISHPQQVNFGNHLTLLGYDLAQPSLRAGEAFELTAYWQAPQSGATNYSILAQVVDEAQHLYAGQDNLHPGNLPVSRWEPWGYVRDVHTVPVPAGTPPGHYFLVTGPYNPADWSRLPVLTGGQSGWPDVFAIPVTISKAAQPPSLAELEIAWPRDVLMGQLRWLGASSERDYINPNDFLRIALFWEASVQPTRNYQIQLRLVDESGQVRLESVNQPSHNRYPTREWSAGERVRDNHAWWIPADFPAGRYRLELNLLDETARPLGAWQVVGEMSLTQ